MLIDLGRNDVGRVSKIGSVIVTDKMTIEKYSHVMHIVSNVMGKIASGLSYFDVLKASLPAGTLSGAPKIRAMEIINELEAKLQRHIWRSDRLYRVEWKYGYSYSDKNRCNKG
jgi:anthranilate synthase component 1